MLNNLHFSFHMPYHDASCYCVFWNAIGAAVAFLDYYIVLMFFLFSLTCGMYVFEIDYLSCLELSSMSIGVHFIKNHFEYELYVVVFGIAPSHPFTGSTGHRFTVYCSVAGKNCTLHWKFTFIISCTVLRTALIKYFWTAQRRLI